MMKMKNTNLDNFDYIKFKLSCLIDPSKLNDLNRDRLVRIKKKLNITHVEILDKIVCYLQLILVAKLCFQLENDEYSEKWFKLKDYYKDSKSLLNKYISSIDGLDFLEFIAKLTYWLAKIEAEDIIKLQRDHLISWNQWDLYLKVNNKNSRKGEKMKAKLRVIMGNQIDGLEKIKERREEDVDRFLTGKMHLFVNIDREIDFEKAENKDNVILPYKWLGEKQDFRVIEEDDNFVNENGKTYTLKKYYLDIAKEKINKNWLKNKSLLNQVITVYLIKRCQNGDQEAFSILFGLYKDTAKKLEAWFIKKYYYMRDIDYLMLDKSTDILSALLKGDEIHYLFEQLDKSQKEKRDEHIFVINKKIYDALEDSYNAMYKYLSGQLLMLEHYLEVFEEKTRNPRNRLTKVQNEKKRLEYLQKIFYYSTDLIHRVDLSCTTFQLFNPNDFLKISSSYNKFLFTPSKETNLTTWLFGKKEGNFKGKIYDYLRDMLPSEVKNKSKSNNLDYSEISEKEDYRNYSEEKYNHNLDDDFESENF